MQETFIEFIIANFNVSVFISVIVYKIFNILLDKLITPFIYVFVDPDSNLQSKEMKMGNYTIEYGKSIGDTVVLVIILFLIYFLFRSK